MDGNWFLAIHFGRGFEIAEVETFSVSSLKDVGQMHEKLCTITNYQSERKPYKRPLTVIMTSYFFDSGLEQKQPLSPADLFYLDCDKRQKEPFAEACLVARWVVSYLADISIRRLFPVVVVSILLALLLTHIDDEDQSEREAGRP